ncbi:hypothetical protein DCAR_0624206 [Daucus carota subsp. sativus]|uniref:Uncharacterized protein n=1 Tax=Daucus carota subsp. sativus TaxID=79200 RepID=A0AAF0XD67_DAUCS|nr:hypothetical protein DCAR_0624206 [Daucus carota subsp. sativus]
MDLGCLDMGCLEKLKNHQSSVDSTDSPRSSSSKSGKKRTVRDSHPSLSGLSKVTSQIKKPSRRKVSPINWFPRTKDVDGMRSTLDETLGDSNPHYSRVLREKIAVREAAKKALEARKAALVEASWCRILKASRIETKEAETMLLKAENTAAEAFEAAKAIGVIMYDIPDYSQKHYQIETLNVNGGDSTRHTVRTSFETAFEVDKQVAAAVKAAFINLANCTSKDEIKEMLRTISHNPDTDDSNLEGLSSECESDTGSEFESASVDANICSQDVDAVALVGKARQRKYKRQFPEKHHKAKLVDMMLERIKCLKDDELASLATIVATCGLSAVLAKAENIDQHNLGAASDHAPAANLPRRVSSFGAGRTRTYHTDVQLHNQVETEIPSLDKFLVKRLTRLEREVQEAKNSKINKLGEEGYREEQEKPDHEKVCSSGSILTADLGSILVKHKSKLEKEVEEAKKNSGKMFVKDPMIAKGSNNSSEVVPDLGSVLNKKHVSKLKKEIEEAKREMGKLYEPNGKKAAREQNWSFGQTQQDVSEFPSLDKTMVKHMSRLEREVQEARFERKREADEKDKGTGTGNNSAVVVPDLESMLTRKHVSKFKKEIEEAKRENGKLYESNGKKTERKQNWASGQTQKDGSEFPSLEKALVKRMSRLEREVLEARNGKKKKPSIADSVENSTCSLGGQVGKENIDLNQELETTQNGISIDFSVETSIPNEQSILEAAEALSLDHKGLESSNGCESSLDKIVVKPPVHRVQKEKTKAFPVEADQGSNVADCESLDKVLIKHVSRLEKEKLEYGKKQEVTNIKKNRETKKELESSEGSLDQILIKPKSRLEREKISAAQQSDSQILHSATRRQAREKEMQQAWGGLSLGNSILPRQSRLQRDKAAWQKAEEEERMRATEHV